MNNPIKLSICIATFNRHQFIAATLDAIVKQMRYDVELIVVDGASTDNTYEIMTEYSAKYKNVFYYRELENSGVDRDYDKAVGYARGEYCWLMTDDDLLCDGAISRVLENLDGVVNLVVVNAKVMNASLTSTLDSNILKMQQDRIYTASEIEEMFIDLASYLSFIGCVVIKRSVWSDRHREAYYGSLFIHVGVIFQDPPIVDVKAIAAPMIIIRWGNAMWSARAFEIWMFKWPKLIWSFDFFTEQSRSIVSSLEPWQSLTHLAFQRAVGGYSICEYNLHLKGHPRKLSRAISYLIALFPSNLMNVIATLYALAAIRKARSRVYDLAYCKCSSWTSRLAARILKV